MDTATYYGMIITFLIGLTFVVLFLTFLYMVYGKTEERGSPPSTKFLREGFLKILPFIYTIL